MLSQWHKGRLKIEGILFLRSVTECWWEKYRKFDEHDLEQGFSTLERCGRIRDREK